MNRIRKIKIISHIVVFSVLLNFCLCYITLNTKLNLSIAFSSVAGAATYSYDPIQFANDLKDKIPNCLYKKADKQDTKKNESNNTADNRKKDFIISVFSHTQIKSFRQVSNFYIDKCEAGMSSFAIYSSYGKFSGGNPVVFAFSFMLLMWLAIIFRKERWFLKNIKNYNKSI